MAALPLLRHSIRGSSKASAKTVFLLHGWPDPSSELCFAKQIPVLEEAGYRVVLVDLPGYGPGAADPAYNNANSWRPPTVDEIAEMLVRTVSHVMDNNSNKRSSSSSSLPYIISHDWGAIITNAAIYNEYQKQKNSDGGGHHHHRALFEKVIMLDVAGEVHPFKEWGLYAFAMVLLYQTLAALSYLLPWFLGDALHRTFTKMFRVPHAELSRGRMGYLYVYVLSSPLLWGTKTLMWYARSSTANCSNSHFVDYEQLVRGGVMFCEAAKKPFLFSSGKWREFCSTGKKNQLIQYPTVDHWFFLRTHPVEFNKQMLSFLS